MNKVPRAEPQQKLTERIDIPCSEELRDQLIALSMMLGKPKAQLAREFLTVQVVGMFALMENTVTWPATPVDGKN